MRNINLILIYIHSELYFYFIIDIISLQLILSQCSYLFLCVHLNSESITLCKSAFSFDKKILKTHQLQWRQFNTIYF